MQFDHGVYDAAILLVNVGEFLNYVFFPRQMNVYHRRRGSWAMWAMGCCWPTCVSFNLIYID